jgi:hypothetical protein
MAHAAVFLLGMTAVAFQVFLAARDPAFQGLLPYNGSEEGMYFLRTQHALRHPFTDATNGVWTGPDAARGPQAAGTEELLGALFSWTGLSAPWLVFFLSVLIAPTILPLGAALLRRTGVSPWVALGLSVLFWWILAFNRRYFHPAFSLPLVMGSLLLLWRWYERPGAVRALLAGLPIGLAVGVYLWAWTFLWACAGLLCAAVLLDRSLPQRRAALRSIPWLAAGMLLTGGPQLLRLFLVRGHPLFDAVSVRVGLVHSRLPESLPRSVLSVLLAAAAVWLLLRHRRHLWPLLAILAALAVMYNQQLVHGVVMSFSSHYINYLMLAALLLCAALVAHRAWKPASLAVIALCAVQLVLGFRDVKGRVLAFLPPEGHTMRFQHLRPALDLLEREGGGAVLTDRRAADIVASYTGRDLAFTEYSAFLLVTDEEFTERACLSELFAAPFDYADAVVHGEERLRVLRGQETQEEYERSLAAADAICRRVRADPAPVLARYGVTHLLWDERNRPDWRIDERLFSVVERGEGWSVWARAIPRYDFPGRGLENHSE